MTPTQTKQLSTTRGVSCNISSFHWYIPGIYLVYTGSLSWGVPPIVNQAWHRPDTVEILKMAFTILKVYYLEKFGLNSSVWAIRLSNPKFLRLSDYCLPIVYYLWVHYLGGYVIPIWSSFHWYIPGICLSYVISNLGLMLVTKQPTFK